MNWSTIRGKGSSEQAEVGYLSGYNGNGDEVVAGTPVCWDVPSADMKTFKIPAAANFGCVAGILDETVGTAGYTDRIIAYGKVTARTYGVATTFVPGANLAMVFE